MSDVIALRQRLLEKVPAASTVKSIMERFRVVMNEAKISGLISSNPADLVPRLETKSRESRFTRDELKKLFGKRPGPWLSDMLWVAELHGQYERQIHMENQESYSTRYPIVS